MGDNKLILVTGGCGYVGSGIVLFFLDQGWKVITMSRSADRIKRLLSFVPEEQKTRLVVKQVGLTDLQSAVSLREEIIAQYGELNHVVASFLAWPLNNISGYKMITEVTYDEAAAAMVDTMRPYFLLQKAFVPYLDQREGTTFVIISGMCSEMLFPPLMGALPLANSAISGISVALRSLSKDGNLAVSDIRIGCEINSGIGEERYLPFEVPAMDSYQVGALVIAMVNNRFRDVVRFTSPEEYQDALKIVNDHK